MNESEEGLKRYGLNKIAGGDGSYAIEGTKNTIIHKLTSAMTTDVAKGLGSASISTTGSVIAASLGGNQSTKNEALAMVLFGNSIGEKNWYNSSVKNVEYLNYFYSEIKRLIISNGHSITNEKEFRNKIGSLLYKISE